MANEQPPPRSDVRNSAGPDDRSLQVVVWVTVAVNALLTLFTLAGWFGRPTSCDDACAWRPIGGMLWVLLVIVDMGLVLIWAGIGYRHLVRFGERIGNRISGERDGDTKRG